MQIGTILERPLGPVFASAPPEEVALSTRVRLARNVRDLPFQARLNEEAARRLIDRVEAALAAPPPAEPALALFALDALPPLARQVLVEKHLISRELAEAPAAAVLLSADERVSLMVGEEDHFRLQVFAPGLRLQEAYRIADRLDDWLDAHFELAFDDRFGYQTSCPTNVGTGLRASVMLHLPGLVLTRQIGNLLPAIQKVGLAVRGVYGEGSDAEGHLFQVSNQITLGPSEEEILENLQGVVETIIAHEGKARKLLAESMGRALEDRVMRSLGILRYARSIDGREAMERLSDVRLGIALGLIRDVDLRTVDALWVMIRPAYLQYSARENLSPERRDARRADVIRRHLGGAP
ncbi:MAG: protein arginine kinase [Hydrogenibacillus schlegelii]|uniref:Protein-arginine kinase n=1 Tax=Hydrogenibacillus schlegelii TaxID=1484 RepID=A0A947CXU5_HYDSH|nr:protein arginine kinase [Hydrogenibacillus schlegelii]